MSYTNSQTCLCAPELTATAAGGGTSFGPLLYPPVIIIFDNQGTVPIAIGVGAVTWRTFPAGEALILDLRAAHGIASNFRFDVGTVFKATGASGTFSISYVYADPSNPNKGP